MSPQSQEAVAASPQESSHPHPSPDPSGRPVAPRPDPPELEVGDSVNVHWPHLSVATLAVVEGQYVSILISRRGQHGHPVEWLVPIDAVRPR